MQNCTHRPRPCYAQHVDEHIVTLRPPVWALLLAVILGGAFYVGGKQIEQRAQNLVTISVTGEGKVSVAPDIAELMFGVQTGPQTTAKQAMAKLERDMKAVLKAVKDMDIEEKDIRTQQLWLNPLYDWSNGHQTLRGYEANQQLTVKVRDLDKVGDVLSRVTQVGANQVGGVNFTVDDPEDAQADARQEAIAEAKLKAGRLAADLGMQLGKVRGFSEGGWVPPVMPLGRGVGGGGDMAMEKALEVPAGEQEIVVQVTLVYELR